MLFEKAESGKKKKIIKKQKIIGRKMNQVAFMSFVD